MNFKFGSLLLFLTAAAVHPGDTITITQSDVTCYAEIYDVDNSHRVAGALISHDWVLGLRLAVDDDAELKANVGGTERDITHKKQAGNSDRLVLYKLMTSITAIQPVPPLNATAYHHSNLQRGQWTFEFFWKNGDQLKKDSVKTFYDKSYFSSVSYATIMNDTSFYTEKSGEETSTIRAAQIMGFPLVGHISIADPPTSTITKSYLIGIATSMATLDFHIFYDVVDNLYPIIVGNI